MSELISRARKQPELHIALWELRLEATRRPDLVPILTEIVEGSFEADLAFLGRSGLPGGTTEVQLLHLAMNGLILELLTLPQALRLPDDEVVVRTLVDRLVY